MKRFLPIFYILLCFVFIVGVFTGYMLCNWHWIMLIENFANNLKVQNLEINIEFNQSQFQDFLNNTIQQEMVKK